MAHRLELAVKDALKQTSFDLIDEIFLRLYLLYENSQKMLAARGDNETSERMPFS